MHKYILLLLAFLTLFISCKNDKKVDSNEGFSENSTHNNYSLSTFSKFPEQIDGCSCYFSNNKNSFEKGIYIYVDNLQDVAIIYLNGLETSFKRVEYKKSENSTLKNSTFYKFVNGDLELLVRKTVVLQIEETWQQEVLITLKENGKTIISKELFGECGC